ncbi:MAG: DUF2795 domain-containing protein [Rhodospirillaceae bacterium]|nr:DUF2795 domain-containing protein [Rhodospirillales bacterium]
MARTLVKALEGLNFPCDRARIMEYASHNDIAPRAMDFLQRLPEQQYASMAELFTALPSKGSLRKPRPQLIVVEPPENLPVDEHEEPAVQRAQEDQTQPDEKAEAAAADENKEQDEDEGQDQRSEPFRTPTGDQGQGQDWRPPNLTAAATRTDPFGAAGQWQQLWLDLFRKSAEDYIRLFMPWLRR